MHTFEFYRGATHQSFIADDYTDYITWFL